MPRFKTILFYQHSPKIIFEKKNAKISSAGGPVPRPPIASGGWGLGPQTTNTTQPPQLRISGYAPATLCTSYNHMGVLSICFEQFFLHRSVANLMMLTIDVCLMLILLFV